MPTNAVFPNAGFVTLIVIVMIRVMKTQNSAPICIGTAQNRSSDVTIRSVFVGSGAVTMTTTVGTIQMRIQSTAKNTTSVRVISFSVQAVTASATRLCVMDDETVRTCRTRRAVTLASLVEDSVQRPSLSALTQSASPKNGAVTVTMTAGTSRMRRTQSAATFRATPKPGSAARTTGVSPGGACVTRWTTVEMDQMKTIWIYVVKNSAIVMLHSLSVLINGASMRPVYVTVWTIVETTQMNSAVIRLLVT